MKFYIFVILFAMVGAAFINIDNKNEPGFDQLYALEGNWMMKTKRGFIGEAWTKINKDHLQNRGYMVRGNDTITTERVALRNTKEGIYYVSIVEDQNNQQPTSFRLTSATNHIFVFENRQHDYPKRITYHFINKDSLDAWIDDGKEIPEKKSMFRYSRQK